MQVTFILGKLLLLTVGIYGQGLGKSQRVNFYRNTFGGSACSQQGKLVSLRGTFDGLDDRPQISQATAVNLVGM